MLANFPPTLRLDFVGATALDSRITFTRTSAGTYFDSSGVLQTASAGTPRFQYSAALGNTALLIERTGTNICLWNRDLTNAAWVATNMTAALDQTGIDNAANSASSIAATAANATILQTRVAGSANRNFSAYVKRITGTGGVDMTTDGGATWTAITVTGSWARQNIPVQTLANPQYGFRLQTNGDKIAVDYCQNEPSSSSTVSVASSPIATTTTSVTRNADSAVIGTLGSWFNSLEGTLLVRVVDTRPFSAHALAAFSDGGANQKISLRYSTTNFIFQITDGGVNQANITIGSYAAGLCKMAGTYKANRFHDAANGTIGPADSAGTVPTVSELDIGMEGAGTNPIDALLCDLAYWNRSRSDGALVSLTKL